MSAGYSGKSLVDKLGYLAGENVSLVRAPQWFQEYLDNNSITTAVKGPYNWLHVFCENEQQLTAFCQDFDPDTVTKGLWVSWPKKSSGLQSDITEQSFRDYILPLGWVDVKVAAIDETWSGLKFVRRKS